MHTVPESHPNFRVISQLNQAMTAARKQLTTLYRQRDVLMGLRENVRSKKLKVPLAPPVFGKAAANAPGNGPESVPSTPQRRATDLPVPPATPPVSAATSMAQQLFALLSAAPGVGWTTEELTRKLGLSRKFKETVKNEMNKLVQVGRAKVHGRGRWIVATTTAGDILDARA